jgi:hypothetical protein
MQKYRMLRKGEVIEEGDEYLNYTSQMDEVHHFKRKSCLGTERSVMIRQPRHTAPCGKRYPKCPQLGCDLLERGCDL